MYRAVADQLIQLPQCTVKESLTASKAPHMLLRSMCVTALREKKSQFEPFIVLEGGESFDDYCEKVRNTAEWGGQLELRALAQALQETIVVVSAIGDDVVMGEEFRTDSDSPVICLSYHKHYLALGEHYNSTEPMKS